MMPYRGIYINLDRCPERRRAMESEFARFNLAPRYGRLRAADGNQAGLASPLKNPGEIGCFLSHAKAVQENLDAGQNLHVIEDDTVFANCAAQTLDWAIASGELDAFDILYTDIAMPLANDSYRMFKSLFDEAVTRDAAGTIGSVKFRALDLKEIAFLTTSSYLVNKHSLRKLNRLYEDEIAENIRLPIDLFFRNQAQVGALKIGCLFPFVTSINVEDTLTSTVRRNDDPTRRFTAANIGRYSFFVGCDWEKIKALMDKYIAQPPAGDRHAQLLARLLAFSLIDKLAK
jgi:GR25 family glycosyltransferase involved in LPS biosynthesis